jgi:hypothetical protein
MYVENLNDHINLLIQLPPTCSDIVAQQNLIQNFLKSDMLICGNEKETKRAYNWKIEAGEECAGVEKKCNKLLSCTVTVKCNEGNLQCNQSFYCTLPLFYELWSEFCGYSYLNYTFSHNFFTLHYKTTFPIIVAIMSETFSPKILEGMWQSSCWGTRPHHSYATNYISPRFSTTESSKNITPMWV